MAADEPEALRDARRFGLPEDEIDALRLSLAGPGAIYGEGLWPENADAVAAFLAVETQWRTATLGGGLAPGRLLFIGLDYAAVRVSLDALAVTTTPALWSALQVMEAEARAALNGQVA